MEVPVEAELPRSSQSRAVEADTPLHALQMSPPKRAFANPLLDSDSDDSDEDAAALPAFMKRRVALKDAMRDIDGQFSDDDAPVAHGLPQMIVDVAEDQQGMPRSSQTKGGNLSVDAGDISSSLPPLTASEVVISDGSAQAVKTVGTIPFSSPPTSSVSDVVDDDDEEEEREPKRTAVKKLRVLDSDDEEEEAADARPAPRLASDDEPRDSGFSESTSPAAAPTAPDRQLTLKERLTAKAQKERDAENAKLAAKEQEREERRRKYEEEQRGKREDTGASSANDASGSDSEDAKPRKKKSSSKGTSKPGKVKAPSKKEQQEAQKVVAKHQRNKEVHLSKSYKEMAKPSEMVNLWTYEDDKPKPKKVVAHIDLTTITSPDTIVETSMASSSSVEIVQVQRTSHLLTEQEAGGRRRILPPPTRGVRDSETAALDDDDDDELPDAVQLIQKRKDDQAKAKALADLKQQKRALVDAQKSKPKPKAAAASDSDSDDLSIQMPSSVAKPTNRLLFNSKTPKTPAVNRRLSALTGSHLKRKVVASESQWMQVSRHHFDGDERSVPEALRPAAKKKAPVNRGPLDREAVNNTLMEKARRKNIEDRKEKQAEFMANGGKMRRKWEQEQEQEQEAAQANLTGPIELQVSKGTAGGEEEDEEEQDSDWDPEDVDDEDRGAVYSGEDEDMSGEGGSGSEEGEGDGSEAELELEEDDAEKEGTDADEERKENEAPPTVLLPQIEPIEGKENFGGAVALGSRAPAAGGLLGVAFGGMSEGGDSISQFFTQADGPDNAFSGMDHFQRDLLPAETQAPAGPLVSIEEEEENARLLEEEGGYMRPDEAMTPGAGLTKKYINRDGLLTQRRPAQPFDGSPFSDSQPSFSIPRIAYSASETQSMTQISQTQLETQSPPQSPTPRGASSEPDADQLAEPTQRNAFDALVSGQARPEGAASPLKKQKKVRAPLGHNPFIRDEARLSDDEEGKGMGFGGESGDEDEDGMDQDLSELVDDEKHVDEEEQMEQDALAVQRARMDVDADDAALQKNMEAVAKGDYRKRRNDLVSDDDMSDEEDYRGNRPKKTRVENRTIAGLKNNPKTAAFASSHRTILEADDDLPYDTAPLDEEGSEASFGDAEDGEDEDEGGDDEDGPPKRKMSAYEVQEQLRRVARSKSARAAVEEEDPEEMIRRITEGDNTPPQAAFKVNTSKNAARKVPFVQQDKALDDFDSQSLLNNHTYGGLFEKTAGEARQGKGNLAGAGSAITSFKKAGPGSKTLDSQATSKPQPRRGESQLKKYAKGTFA